MSPLQPFVTSLGIPIEVQLQNTHIIDKSQVLVEIIPNGSDNIQLSSDFKNRDKPQYLHSLGKTILGLSQVIPDGLLIFFPSYRILNSCTKNWQTTEIWNEIQRSKPIFVEPQTKDAFDNTMKNYYKQINSPSMQGAIFMAVCRGKVSEGLDFADINGRAVIITGLPYPPMFDPKIRLKRKYMQLNCTAGSLNGDQWYAMEASRAVNQAIGRVIRHSKDYGAILLCDHRFNQPRQKSQLSAWIQLHLEHGYSTRPFDSMINSISQFFRSQQEVSSADIPSNASMVSQDNQTSPDRVNQLIANCQPMTSTRAIETPFSPMTAVVNQIAGLPLSSPLPSVPSSRINATSASPSTSCYVPVNGTPGKQKCNINLSQRFNEEN